MPLLRLSLWAATAATALGSSSTAAKPGMAWNAWNTFSVNGKPIRGGRPEYEGIAEAMIERGYVAAGYKTLSTVCTDWQPRDPVTHELRENHTLWPGGMKSFAGWLHARGMELVVYTDAGLKNCCQEPGSLGNEALDMKTFASWDVDSIAVDYCGGPEDVQGEYQKFADGIVEAGRPVQLSVCNLGRGAAYRWTPTMSKGMGSTLPGSAADSMRLLGDIGNSWNATLPPTHSVLETFDFIQGLTDLWNFGMGNESGTFPNYGQMAVGVPKNRPTLGDPGLSLIEAQSHFSLWCMFDAILVATNDVRQHDVDIERILLNPETIAINQDDFDASSLAKLTTSRDGETWSRPLANGDIAVLVLNRKGVVMRTGFDWSSLPGVARGEAGVRFRVRDLQVSLMAFNRTMCLAV